MHHSKSHIWEEFLYKELKRLMDTCIFSHNIFVDIQSTYVQFIFKVNNSIAFYIAQYIQSCARITTSISEHFQHPKKNPTAFSPIPHH